MNFIDNLISTYETNDSVIANTVKQVFVSVDQITIDKIREKLTAWLKSKPKQSIYPLTVMALLDKIQYNHDNMTDHEIQAFSVQNCKSIMNVIQLYPLSISPHKNERVLSTINSFEQIRKKICFELFNYEMKQDYLHFLLNFTKITKQYWQKILDINHELFIVELMKEVDIDPTKIKNFIISRHNQKFCKYYNLYHGFIDNILFLEKHIEMLELLHQKHFKEFYQKHYKNIMLNMFPFETFDYSYIRSLIGNKKNIDKLLTMLQKKEVYCNFEEFEDLVNTENVKLMSINNLFQYNLLVESDKSKIIEHCIKKKIKIHYKFIEKNINQYKELIRTTGNRVYDKYIKYDYGLNDFKNDLRCGNYKNALNQLSNKKMVLDNECVKILLEEYSEFDNYDMLKELVEKYNLTVEKTDIIQLYEKCLPNFVFLLKNESLMKTNRTDIMGIFYEYGPDETQFLLDKFF